MFAAREELVVKFGITSREDPTEVLHSAEFMDCLSNEVSEAQLSTLLKLICDLKVFVFILDSQFVNEELYLRVWREVGHIDLVGSSLWDGDTSRKSMVAHVGFGLAGDSGAWC